MKKHNVIDMTTYRVELQRKTPAGIEPIDSPVEISDELKKAIEVLIDKLRAQENGDFNQ